MPSKKTQIVPVQQLRLSDAVAAQLQDLIQSGRFGAEGRLPSERELAEQFGVGRGSMREAMRRLEALGILVKNHGIGTFVANPNGSRSTDIELLHAGDVTALELFQVRYSVEPLAAAMAAERRTAADVRGMEATLAKSLRRAITPEEFVALDFEFHSQVAAASRNRLLARMYQHVQPHHANYSLKVVSFPDRMERAHQGHAKILQAITASDERVAKKEALAHLRSAERDLMREIAKYDSL
jgi:GntR family transcriptional repressor for pyruvate dehydrogenase complex